MNFVLICAAFFFRFSVLAVPFKDLSLETLNGEIERLSGNFAHIKSAEALLGVNKAKDIRTGYQCSPLIARVSHIDSLTTDVERPQVLLSGEIHGDERIGPVATLHTGNLLVNSAKCAIEGNNDACSKLVKVNGLSKPQIVWLAFLATRRDTFIIPSANCLGYKSSVRVDSGVDPNRDFGYSRDHGIESGQGAGNDHCLQSTTAKIFNKLMELTLFQLVITFHGGMQAIAYEWGSQNHQHPRDLSPDDHANKQVGEAFSYIGGYGFPGASKPYPYGPMNAVVYGVDGGMEDWMYAAGWDRGNIPLEGESSSHPAVDHLRYRRKQQKRRRLFGVLHNCTADTNSKNPPNNRALVFLVETSDRKNPPGREWGDDNDILGGKKLDMEGHPDMQSIALGPGANTNGNGHVPRNVRLALTAVDVVQPYVCVNQVTKQSRNGTKGQSDGLKVEWSVGGSFHVDATWLSWHPAEVTEAEMSSSTSFGLGAWQVLHTEIDKVASELEKAEEKGNLHAKSKDNEVFSVLKEVGLGPGSQVQSGNALWSSRSKRESHPTAPGIDPFGAKFNAALDVPESVNEGEYWVAAWAVVDKKWGDNSQGYPSSRGPESWLSRARTNTSLHYMSHEHPLPPHDKQWPSSSKTQPRSIRGRVMWASAPLRVRVSADGAVSLLAVTLQCAWWARGPEAIARNPVPPLAIKIDKPDDKRVPGQIKPVPPSTIDKSMRPGNDAGLNHGNRSSKSIQNAITLLLGFVILILGSYVARKIFPLVYTMLQNWRYSPSHASIPAMGSPHAHMPLAQSEDEADRERELELELGYQGNHHYDDDDDDDGI